MDNRTSFALLAVLTAVGTLTMSSAYAQACVGCEEVDNGRKAANEMLNDPAPTAVTKMLYRSVPDFWQTWTTSVASTEEFVTVKVW